MVRVILTEKPSVAKNIADALKIKNRKDGYFEGEHYIITWAFGHLLQLYDAKDYEEKMSKWKMENFPFFPSSFRYKVKSDGRNKVKEDLGARKQLFVIKQLFNRKDVDAIISACDFDREGQLIGDTIIYNLKSKKEVYRLLLNEWTSPEILKGLQNLRLNEVMRPMLDAGISRQWADWIIGINLTSAATLKYQKGSGKALNIGRVILPTLKIIYDRDQEIKQFKPEDYFKLTASFLTKDNNKYEGIYNEKGHEKFKEKLYLEKIEGIFDNQVATIHDKKVKRKKEYPPHLFNLSNLQGFITSKYRGWTSEKVLKVAQSLYEKKFITYPRTASNVLEESIAEKAFNVLTIHKKGLSYEDEVKFIKHKRIFDNSKVESHSAIIPTYLIPKSISMDEKIVYQTIKNRFIMQFMPIAEYEETIISSKVNDNRLSGLFISKGKVQITEGWKKVERIDSKDKHLPLVELNEVVQLQEHTLSSHTTTPPKFHSEKTLLRVMETCGKKLDENSEELVAAVLNGYSIGTPATRGETIKKLKEVGYIEAENKHLKCSLLGTKLVETFPVRELFDLKFTGRLEKNLYDIEKKRFSKDLFMDSIFSFTKNAVQTIKNDNDITINEVIPMKRNIESLGKCPLCGADVKEGKKGYGCSDWKNGCSFVIWKNDRFLSTMNKKPSKSMIKSLLRNGKVLTKNLKSKNGKVFQAYLSYEKNKDNQYFSWQIEFPDKKS